MQFEMKDGSLDEPVVNKATRVLPDGYAENTAKDAHPTRAYILEYPIEPADRRDPSPSTDTIEKRDTYASGENGDMTEEEIIFASSSKTERDHLLGFILGHRFMLGADQPVKCSVRRDFVRELRFEAATLGMPDEAISRLVDYVQRVYLKLAGVNANPLTQHLDDIPLGAKIDDERHKRSLSRTGHADGAPSKRRMNTKRYLKHLDISTKPEASDQARVPTSPMQISPKADQYMSSGSEQSDLDGPDMVPGSPVSSKIASPSHDNTAGSSMAINLELEHGTDLEPQLERICDNASHENFARLKCTAEASSITLPISIQETQTLKRHSEKASESAQTLPDLNTASLPQTSKSPRPRFPKTSRFFQKEAHEPLSCLPFCSIDFSNFGLVQEQLAHEPFKLLIATIFLNRTRADLALRVLFDEVFEKYPSVDSMAAADEQELASMIHRLGFHNQRARKCIALAQTWQVNPPAKNKRYRRTHYPRKGDGKDIGQDEIVDDEDHRSAWEVAHLPGVGAYSIDSWRMFCRDELRGLAQDWKGTGALASGFVPEWKSVLPLDKELRAYATWMWLKEGWVWDCLTGDLTPASENTLIRARKGGVVYEQGGRWVLQLDPARAPNGLHEEESAISI